MAEKAKSAAQRSDAGQGQRYDAAERPLVLAAAIGSLLLLAAAVQRPGVSRVVGCRPLLPHQWAIALAAATAATVAQLLMQALAGSRPEPGER